MEQKNNYNVSRRQVIERGYELKPESLNRDGGIYAVSYRRNGSDDLQWGIVVFGKAEIGSIETYNLICRNRWSSGLISTMHLHFYEPTQMELDFAAEHKEARKAWNSELRANERVKFYEQNRWHRVAHALYKFFS